MTGHRAEVSAAHLAHHRPRWHHGPEPTELKATSADHTEPEHFPAQDKITSDRCRWHVFNYKWASRLEQLGSRCRNQIDLPAPGAPPSPSGPRCMLTRWTSPNEIIPIERHRERIGLDERVPAVARRGHEIHARHMKARALQAARGPAGAAEE